MAKKETTPGLSPQVSEYASRASGRIQAQVSSFRDGLQIFDKISIVRIRSRAANLLIMEDYMPIIGEIDGSVDFIGKDAIETLTDVRGFFCHDHNVFFLLLKDTRQGSEGATVSTAINQGASAAAHPATAAADGASFAGTAAAGASAGATAEATAGQAAAGTAAAGASAGATAGASAGASAEEQAEREMARV